MQEYSSKKKNREAKLFEIIRDNLNTTNYSEFLDRFLPSESSKLEDTPVALRNVVGSLALQEGERLLNKYDKCNKDSDRLKAKLRHLTDNVGNLLLNRQQEIWIKVACLSQLLELNVEGKLNCSSPKDYLYYRAEQVKPSIMLQRLSTDQQVSILEVLQMFSETELKLPQESLLLEPEILNDLLLSSAKKSTI